MIMGAWENDGNIVAFIVIQCIHLQYVKTVFRQLKRPINIIRHPPVPSISMSSLGNIDKNT